MPANSLQDLYVDKLKDLLDAENQILEALPMMAEATEHAELRKAFETHRKQTEEQVQKLEQLLSQHGGAERKPCLAMRGILQEGQQHMGEVKDPDARDAMLIGSAQAVEHYEITKYGTLIAWARQLGREDCASVLQQNLDEEGATDKKLTAMAEAKINRRAA